LADKIESPCSAGILPAFFGGCVSQSWYLGFNCGQVEVRAIPHVLLVTAKGQAIVSAENAIGKLLKDLELFA